MLNAPALRSFACMTATLWKTLAILSMSVCALLGLGVLYAVLAYGSNLREIARGQAVCLAGERAYDSIAAAQMIGRLDLVSFLLTMGGVLLAIFAFMGFWMVRREVLDQASQVAVDEARKVAQTYYNLAPNEKGTYIMVSRLAEIRQNLLRIQRVMLNHPRLTRQR